MSILHPVNEQEVIYHFIKLEEQFDVDIEIVNFWTSYPDADVLISGVLYKVEFEYNLTSFVQHGHDARECDLVVCWKNNLKTKNVIFPLPVWEISKNDYPSIFVPEPLVMENFIKYMSKRQYSKEWSYQQRYSNKNPESVNKSGMFENL